MGEQKDISTILVVDDDVTFRSIVAKVLSDSGYQVLEASDGPAAIDIAKATTLDLCILDVEMPDMSGIDVASEITNIPILFLSHIEDKTTIDKALSDQRLGSRALGYITKPIDIEKLLPTIQSALGIARDLKVKQNLLETVSLSIEREKRIIARELHDVLGNEISKMKWDAEYISQCEPDEIGDIKERAARIIESCGNLGTTIDAIVQRLRPDALYKYGFKGSIEKLIEDWNKSLPNCEFLFNYDESLNIKDDEFGSALYRVIQESITNIVKHADANSVTIDITSHQNKGNIISLTITDNGRGFDSKGSTNGHGLRNIRERIESLGGNVDISSEKGLGTKIYALIPIRSDK